MYVVVISTILLNFVLYLSPNYYKIYMFEGDHLASSEILFSHRYDCRSNYPTFCS